jgi:hypothetical protein
LSYFLDDNLPAQVNYELNTVGSISTLYFRQIENWRMIRRLMQGTRRIRELAEDYLPRHFREPVDQYKIRLHRAVFTNYFRDAVMNCVSRPFSRKVVFTKETPELMKPWEENIDLKGSTLHTFARLAFLDAVQDGMVHILVDYSRLPDGATLGDEQALGARPYLVRVPAVNLIAAYMGEVNGEQVCVHARIMERHVVRDGYVERTVDRVRVLEPGRYQVFSNLEGQWALEDEGEVKVRGQLLDRVPLFTFYAGDKIDDFWVTPPFIDLAYKNIQHYQLSSDDDAARTRSNFAMLAVKPSDGSMIEGVPNPVSGQEEFIFGADSLLKGDWYYVEPHGRALTSNEHAIKRLEHEMQVLGGAPFQQKGGSSATATEASINSADSTSMIKEWTIEFNNILSRCIDMMAWWAGFEEGAGVMMNSDFQLGNGLVDMQTLLQMRTTGDLSRHTLYEEGQRRGVLSITFDPDQEVDRIEQEKPTYAPAGITGHPGGMDPAQLPQDIGGDGASTGMLPN